MWRCLLLGVAVLAVLGESVWALDPSCDLTQYNTRTWRRCDRLPSNSVNAIVQAEDGHLWLGTPRGLVDFDGTEFRACGLPGHDESRSQNISFLGVRRAGGFWVGTERGGYGWFDGAQFATWPASYLGGELPTTRYMLERPDGTIFISTPGAVGYRLPSGEEKSLAAPVDVLAMVPDREGRIWMGTAAHGLYYWAYGQLHHVDGPAGALWGGNMISALAVDDGGVVWVGAANGLHSINPDLSPRPPIGVGGQARVLLIDSHGALWIGGMFDGVARYHAGRVERLTRREGLASNHVLAMTESADGSLWIGTEDGLSQLADVKFPAVSTGEDYAGETCLSVAAAPDGGIWAGTTNGLSRITDAGLTRYGTNRADGFPSEWIRRVFVARNGDLYLLGGRQDLSRFRNGRVDKVWCFDLWPQSVTEDADGIVVTVGAQLRRLVGEQIVPFTLADGSAPQIRGWINKLFTASDGSLWAAAKPGLVQIRDGQAVNWMHGRNDADQSFYDICEDTQGAIWAVRSSGLVRVKDGRVATVDQRQGLFSDDISTLTPDLLGYLWADFPGGFFRMDLAELNAVADGTCPRLSCTVFEGAHVVRTAEKVNGETSSCRSRDGRIWLPCARGAIRIDPAHLPVNSRPPPMRLDRVLLDGREMPVTGELRPATVVRNLEIDYEAIDYQAPERIRYQYRLEGYQSEWVDAGTRRAAFYTNLAPGRYRFEVRACNADGVWNTVGTGISFIQPRPYHAAWWFRALVALALAGGLALFWISRERARRREIEAIRRLAQLQREMIESSPVPMAMLDQRHCITYVNATFTRVFGFVAPEIPSLDDWWRMSGAATAPEATAGGWTQRIAAAAAARRSIEPVEATLAHKDGSPRQVVVTTSAVGECTLVICTDLTERKQAEDHRRHLEEQLRQTQKMEAIGRLSGGIAHDFNNLLTIVLGNVALLELEKVPGEFAELIHEIKAAASRAANLTRQLLAFSRKQPINPAAIDLNDVVREMTGMLRRIVGEDIVIEVGLAANPVPARVDAIMIEQVFLNLALNARDAMPRGGRMFLDTSVVDFSPASVPEVLNARPGRFSCLTVRDTGAGIPPEVLPRIFEPFFTTKEVGKGTGLGLATVFGIVEQHKGWIEVRSELDRGTTFRVMLPHEPAAEAPTTARKVLSAPPIDSRVILLVEDDTGVRTLARRALTSHGHRVIEAASGAHALPIWHEHRDEIDILFTDVIMPGGLNGIELANRLLAEKPELKVLFASGYSADVAGGNFAGREGIDFIGKPYDPADLLRLIARSAMATCGADAPPLP